MQTLMVEAHVGDDGHLRVDVPTDLPTGHIKAVLVLDDVNSLESHPMETALLSQQALAEDWDRPEEDEAWKHLQSAMSS
jgi:hypothetical protein